MRQSYEHNHEFSGTNTLEEALGPSAKIWSVYVSEAEEQDQVLAQNCQRDMNALLIFTGLFSASLTAFIIESYKNLKPSSDDVTVALLQQISHQLSKSYYNGSSDSIELSTPAKASDSFTPPALLVVCNLLWFLSLGFCLASALTATLAEQWVSNYVQMTQSRSVPSERARIRAYLYRGLERFGMKAVVDTVPILLHTSLFLFYMGLVLFLIPVNKTLTVVAVVVLACSVVLYIWCTLLPIVWSDCPYRTPASPWCWRALNRLRKYRLQLKGFPVRQSQSSSSMAQATMLDATHSSTGREKRDSDVLTSTIQSLDTNERLVEFINHHRPSEPVDIRHLTTMLFHTDLSVRLQRNLDASGACHPDEKTHRIPACLRAISMVADVWTRHVFSGNAGHIYFGTGMLVGLCRSDVADNSGRVLRRNTIFRVLWPLLSEFIALTSELHDALEKCFKADQGASSPSANNDAFSQQQLHHDGLDSRMKATFHELYLLLEETKSGRLLQLLSDYPSFFAQINYIWPLCADIMRILQPSPHSRRACATAVAAAARNAKERSRELHVGLCDAQLFLLMDTLETYSPINNNTCEPVTMDWGQYNAQLSRCPISTLAQERLLFLLMRHNKELGFQCGQKDGWSIHPLLLLKGLIRDQSLIRAIPKVWQAESKIVLVRGGQLIKLSKA